jgi:hypothetical protein
LAEELEHLLQHLRRNSNTCIANAHNDLCFVTPHLDHNANSFRCRIFDDTVKSLERAHCASHVRAEERA